MECERKKDIKASRGIKPLVSEIQKKEEELFIVVVISCGFFEEWGIWYQKLSFLDAGRLHGSCT